jgi:hypothetical protein
MHAVMDMDVIVRELGFDNSISPYIQGLRSHVIHAFWHSPLYEHATVPLEFPLSGQLLP